MFKIPINEFFSTIQGEATFTGTPAFFIRTQECPVGCSFCDTKYTWDLEEEDETDDIQVIINKKDLNHSANEGTPTHIKLNVDEVVTLVKQSKLNHVVFTGGEPCINDLTTVTKKLEEHNIFCQIETSGTFEIKTSNNTWVTLSPKLGKSIKGGLSPLDSSFKRADEIKYPIGKIQDILNLKDLIDKYKLQNKTIWLQPISMSNKATKLCYETAMENNLKVSIQTHKYMNLR